MGVKPHAEVHKILQIRKSAVCSIIIEQTNVVYTNQIARRGNNSSSSYKLNSKMISALGPVLLFYETRCSMRQPAVGFRHRNLLIRVHTVWKCAQPLTRQINCCLLNFSPASMFKVFQCGSQMVKMLSECQTAWIRVRRRVTRCLIRIQAVCIWHYSCAWRSKG